MLVVSVSRACAPSLHGSSHLSQSGPTTKLTWCFSPFCMWTVLLNIPGIVHDDVVPMKLFQSGSIAVDPFLSPGKL